MNWETINVSDSPKGAVMIDAKRLSELWRIARTALAGNPYSRYDRTKYVCDAYMREHPGLPHKRVWNAIVEQFRGYGV